MPEVTITIYRELDGTAPVREWLIALEKDARRRCLDRIELLRTMGHELRRPHAEYIEGTDLYELRIKYRRVNLRILYFFHGRTAVVLAHGMTKERVLADIDLDKATARMTAFLANPIEHTDTRGI